MAVYEVAIRQAADKESRKIPQVYLARIIDAILALSENPFPVQSRKLQGSETSWRIRIGDYRVIYEVDIKNKRVEVIHIRHRQEAYR